jgi:hypothetical protein
MGCRNPGRRPGFDGRLTGFVSTTTTAAANWQRLSTNPRRPDGGAPGPAGSGEWGERMVWTALTTGTNLAGGNGGACCEGTCGGAKGTIGFCLPCYRPRSPPLVSFPSRFGGGAPSALRSVPAVCGFWWSPCSWGWILIARGGFSGDRATVVCRFGFGFRCGLRSRGGFTSTQGFISTRGFRPRIRSRSGFMTESRLVVPEGVLIRRKIMGQVHSK